MAEKPVGCKEGKVMARSNDSLQESQELKDEKGRNQVIKPSLSLVVPERDPTDFKASGALSAVSSPQYKRPWKVRAPICTGGTHQPKKVRAALSLASRFESEESDRTSSQSGGSFEDASLSPSAANGAIQGHSVAVTGSTSSSGCAGAQTEGPLAGMALRLSLGSSSRNEDPTEAKSLALPASSKTLPTLPFLGELDERHPGDCCDKCGLEEEAVSRNTSGTDKDEFATRCTNSTPHYWAEDPVFQGMDFVGCTHLYTAQHYERYLKRQLQKVEAAGTDCVVQGGLSLTAMNTGTA